MRAQTLTRLTDGSGDQAPVWTHDGLRLIYSSQRDGARALFRQFADGTGMVEKLTATPFAKWPSAVSLDGTRVVVTEVNDKTGDDVAVVWLDGDKRTVPLVTTTSAERSADLSPDGRHLAYQSNEAEQDQIFVRPFPDVNNARWQITTAGGTHPRWAPNGRELFYVDVGGSLNVVQVSTNEGFKWGPPAVMLRTKYLAGVTRGAVYDVTRDGQRFVMIKESDTGNSVPANASFNIVLNWTEELKQRAPTK